MRSPWPKGAVVWAGIAAALFSASSPGLPATQGEEARAQKLQQQVVTAVGGQEALARIQSLRITSKFATNSRFVDQTTLRQRPNLYSLSRGSWQPGREEDVLTRGFDGSAGWAVDPTAEPPGLQAIDADRAMSLATEARIFWSILELPDEAQLTFEGLNETELGLFNELRIEVPGSPKETWFLDPTSHLPIALYTERWDWDRLREIRYYFDDWREVEGVLFPFLIEDEFSSFHRMQRTVEIEVNAELPKASFSAPN